MKEQTPCRRCIRITSKVHQHPDPLKREPVGSSDRRREAIVGNYLSTESNTYTATLDRSKHYPILHSFWFVLATSAINYPLAREAPPRFLARFVSPPAIAATNAKRNHFPHHLEVTDAAGGPVGLAGTLGRNLPIDFSLSP